MYKRAGIIPFFKISNEVYVVLMISRYDGKICDMGGHVDPGESFIQAAIRESREESRDFFKFETKHVFSHGTLTFKNKKKTSTAFFIPVNFNDSPETLTEFCNAYRQSFKLGVYHHNDDHTLENKDFIFLSFSELKQMLINKPTKISSVNNHLTGDEYPEIDDLIVEHIENFIVKQEIKMYD